MFIRYKREIIGVIIGAIAGWCYWYFVGCSSGSCPISSKPLNNTLYGAVVGFLGAGILKKKPKESGK
jgi:Family of unknown function (DUF6132)